MKNSKSSTFKDFIIEFPQLKDKFRALIASHYSFDIFNSLNAKSEYLEADELAFDLANRYCCQLHT